MKIIILVTTAFFAVLSIAAFLAVLRYRVASVGNSHPN
jgi:hypothetical protein